MMACQVLPKGESVWKWLSKYYVDEKHGSTILERFSLTDGFGDVIIFNEGVENRYTDMSIFNNPENCSFRFLKPIKALRYYLFNDNIIVELRRDPHKLNLGIEEFMIVNKTTIFDKL
jgi:hypothetical protein